VQGKKYKNKCDNYKRKWVGTEKYKGICRIYNDKLKKNAVKEGKMDFDCNRQK